jgi:hypothetical protein
MNRGLVFVLVLAVGVAGLAGCARVHNGTVVDVAEVPLGGARKVELPAGAVVTRDGAASVMRVEMKKRLGFHGHPPRTMSIEAGRRLMGVASRRVGDILTVATFGDFSTKEGSATIQLSVRLPATVEVEQRPDLEGDASPARGTDSGREHPDTYWYASPQPAAGWTPHTGN